jgi:SAM-dependent methyltransferase
MRDQQPLEPIALEAYEALAEPFAARVDTKPHNAYYERPATLSLLPDVQGKRVLDAGCGPGVYAEWLLNHGALVVGFDVSDKMVHLARQRLGTKADIQQADLGKPLDFLADASFDIVLSTLVLDYVKDWERLFREFFRVLRQHGHLIFSVGHPFADFMAHPQGNYFRTELIEYEFRGFGTPVRVPTYRRPLSALINPLLDVGFTLERLIEPTPIDAFRQTDPKDYAELSRQPGFLCVRARK